MTDRPSALPRYTHPLVAEDPDSFGPYLLLARIATGTTGTVYLSRGSSGAWVAVRALHPGHARRTDLRARFAAAVTRANRVEGRGTCAVVDAAVEAEIPYVVFEFVDGPTLAAEVGARGPLAAGELHQTARDLAGAVASLQQARVVHGALEPSDVVLSVSGTRLVDLATSRALTSLLPSEPGHDLVLAPEVRAGGEPGSAADVFGWASLVWFAATGQLAAANAGRLPAVPGLDDTLGTLLSGALRDDPADRPTATDLVARLAPAPRNGRRGKLGSAAVAAGVVGPSGLTPPAGSPPPHVPHPRPPAAPPTSTRARPAAGVAAVFETPPQPADDEPTPHRGKRALVAGAVFLAVAASAAAVAPAVSASGGSDSVETAAETDVSSVPADSADVDADVAPPVLAPPQSPTPGPSSSAAPDASAAPVPSDSPAELTGPSIPLVALAPGGGESGGDQPAAPPPVAAAPEPARAVDVAPIEPAPVVPVAPTTAPAPVPPAAPPPAAPPPAPPQPVAAAQTQAQPDPTQPYVAATPPPPPPPPASPEPAVSPSPSGLAPKEIPVIQLTRSS